MMNNGMAGIDALDDSVDYQDTIALLQDEIARLEEELRLRDEARAEASPMALGEAQPQWSPTPDPAQANRITELTAEVSRRDETIALLLEEIRLIEEAEAAGRAEWEHLNQWVEQVEQRVDSRDGRETQLEQELGAERRKSEAQQHAIETERHAWANQRKALEEEVERMRAQLAAVAKKKQADSNAELALAALESENRRLRRACDDLNRAAAAASQVDSLRNELDSARSQLDEAQAKIRSLEDDMQRAQKEHEAALAALRSQLAHEPLQRKEDQEAAPAPARDLSQVTPEERMQAFRQHLQDVHQREVEERSQKRLSARLSRLWHRTGPSR